MKKIVFILFVFILSFTAFLSPGKISCAVDGEIGENYLIYNEEGGIICEKSGTQVHRLS